MINKLKLGLPVQLILMLAFVFLFGDYFPHIFIAGAYAISLSIKELLLYVMPFIIFSFIFSCLVSFRGGSFKFLVSLLGSVCLSNFVSTMIAFSVSMGAIHVLQGFSISTMEAQSTLTPAWDLSLQRLIPNDWALFAGLAFGLLGSFQSTEKLEKVSEFLKKAAHGLLNRVFIPILPLFIFGFILKMQFEGTIVSALTTYAPIALLFFATQILYVGLLYGVGADYNFNRWVEQLKNVMPAGMTALSTMSSLASMPYTLQAAEKNTNGDEMVDVIVPATVNVHLVGDSIAIPMMALAILFNMGMPMPTLSLYLIFAFYFVVNKFAVAAVPGGGILVMLPVLQQYLQFNDEMLSLITMLYILFDAIITFVNVLGNGAFAILFTRFYRRQTLAWGKP